MQSDPITIVRYYDYHAFSFRKFMMKDHSFFGSISKFFFGSRLQNSGNEHEHGFL